MQDFEGEKEPLTLDRFHNVIFSSLEKVKNFNDVCCEIVLFKYDLNFKSKSVSGLSLCD